MLGHIVNKELRDTFKSLRFTAGMLVMLLLTLAAVFLLSGEYSERRERFAAMERSQDTFISQYAHPNRAGWILAPNRPLVWTGIFFRGLDNPNDYNSFFANDLRRVIPNLDLLAIVSLLISLLAIIFAHDAICGEREAGTLKMLHANAVGRRTVVLGKILGLWLATAIPFLGVYLLAVLVGALLTGIGIGLEQALVLTLIAGAFVLYIGFFIGLGVLVSGVVRHPGTSILVLLLLWTVLTMVVPNISPVIASQIEPLPSVEQLQNETARIRYRERDVRIKEAMAGVERKLRAEYDIPDTTQNLDIADNLKALGWPDEKIHEFREKFEADFMPIVERMNEEQDAKARALEDELTRKVERQSDVARGISLLSPASSLTYFVTDAADLGLLAEKDFDKQRETYYEVLIPFVRERWKSEEQRLGKKIDYEDFVDFSGYPRFSRAPVPLAKRLEVILPWAGHLAIMFLLVVLFGIVAYLRYDVR